MSTKPKYDKTTAGYSPSATTHTLTHTAGPGFNGVIVIGIRVYYAGAVPTVSSVTLNGSAMTIIAGTQTAAYIRGEAWYKLAPNAGVDNTIVVTLSSAALINYMITTYYNVRQVAPNTSSSAVLNVTPNQDATGYHNNVTTTASCLIYQFVATERELWDAAVEYTLQTIPAWNTYQMIAHGWISASGSYSVGCTTSQGQNIWINVNAAFEYLTETINEDGFLSMM